MRYGLREDGDDSIEMMFRTRGAGFGPEVKRRIMLGTYALSAGYYDAYYGQAQKVRTLIIRDYEAAFADFDVLVSPTSPTTAFPIGEKADDPMAMYLNDIFTIPANLAGTPAISVPCGLDSAGLPIGLQLTAPVLGEQTLVPRRRRPRRRARPRPPAAAARRRLSPRPSRGATLAAADRPHLRARRDRRPTTRSARPTPARSTPATRIRGR